MVSYLPRQISKTAIYLYIGALAAVSLLYIRFSMPLWYTLLGLMWVIGFFLLSNHFSEQWARVPQKKYIKFIFWTALGLRAAWVIFSYFFYKAQTGVPFEFAAADSLMYHDDATWLASTKWKYAWDYLFTSRITYSDSGYPLYLSLVYRLLGPNIIPARLLKALLGAFSCILLYRLASRNIGEEGGRMAGVFACFMPNLIIYCGLHLKETEMLFLLIAFLERTDNLLRSKHYTVLSVAVPILLALSLFFFRTVLGAAAAFSFVTAILFTPSRTIGKGKRFLIIGWVVLTLALLAGGTIINETESYWEQRDDNQNQKRTAQTIRGNQWAKYATGTVMAPMMFVLPFPTMVDVEQQYNQNIMHGGNYVRNFFGIFVLIAVFSAIFIKKDWRNYALIGSFVIAYLGIISASGFANSERFLLPGLPVFLILAANGITLLNAKNYRWVRIWYCVVPVMVVAWAFFKVGSRGLF